MSKSEKKSEEKKEASEDLKSTIQNRIEELTKEIQRLINNKDAYSKAIRETDIKLTQMVGAVNELKSLISNKEESEEQEE